MASPPKIRVFVVCDAAVQDGETGKITLVGIFDRIAARQFPVTREPFAIYFRLTGLNGQYELRVRILGPDLQTVLADVGFERAIYVTDPLATTDAILNVAGLDLPVPGRYTVRLDYNAILADEISFLAERLP